MHVNGTLQVTSELNVEELVGKVIKSKCSGLGSKEDAKTLNAFLRIINNQNQ
jgi:hypothetical protein